MKSSTGDLQQTLRSPAYRGTALRSGWQLIATSVLFIASEGAAIVVVQHSIPLALALDVFVAGLLVRLFIIQHDCGHGSFFSNKRWNDVVGTILGFITLTPYRAWRHDHAVHHGTVGDLDRRGTGDIGMLTVDEYLALPRLRRLRYRMYRSLFVMFVIGPIFVFLISNRFPRFMRPRALSREERMGVHITNLFGAAVLASLYFIGGWKAVVLVHLLSLIVAGGVGIFLFYVQHQFEDVYWRRHGQWSPAAASFEGSSYLKLPAALQYFTGSVGLHHIHHLHPGVPNYRLQKTLEEIPGLQSVVTMGLGGAAHDRVQALRRGAKPAHRLACVARPGAGALGEAKLASSSGAARGRSRGKRSPCLAGCGRAGPRGACALRSR